VCLCLVVFENTCKYLGMAVTNQNYIHKEVKSRLNSGNNCYHSVQNLSTHLLSKDAKIKIYETINVVLFWCESWCLAQREERRVRTFVNRVPRRIFGWKKNCIMRSFIC
jgi:hypothetical protein